ncbi:histidine kinase [uncultured Acetobacteroides sp.]|uniref:sensor histidine kinase n=1 Tax=uncultured Acetobacteroides sp. TaxID=1760811 RepID=UPI0029F51808|nr:histidine kinase [uncultured Acetobacteroides sp.]
MSIYSITGSQRTNALLNIRWVRHLLYWCVTIGFFTLFWGSEKNSYGVVFLNELLMLPPKLLAVYTLLLVLVPQFLFKKKLLLFTLLTLAVMVVCGIILLLDQYLVTKYVLNLYVESPVYLNRFKALSAMVDINTVLIIPLVIKIVEHGYRNLQRSERLEKEKLETELKYLKTQIHPHFFFNTLNNLYALVLRKSDKAPDVVLTLSELMRYVLYDSNAPKVSLEKELKHIGNYINLEKLRLPLNAEIKFDVTGNTAAMAIEPMLLIPIIENCFKHVSTTSDGKCWIHISISVDDSQLLLITENSMDEQPNREDDDRQGVGLQNVERRLELLYPERYELKCISDGFSYLCKLKILLC